MPELIMNGPAGRLEARYHHDPKPDSPIAKFEGADLSGKRFREFLAGNAPAAR